jgi:hypothetical protein
VVVGRAALAISCTLSTSVGVAGSTLLNTHRFADAITKTAGQANADITATVANHPAQLLLDVLGYEWVQLVVDLTGATAANALYRAL